MLTVAGPLRLLKDVVVDPPTEWSRRKLQVLMGVAVLVAVAMIGGLVWSVMGLLSGGSTAVGGSGGTREQTGGSPEDQLADRPLPRAPLEAAQPGQLSSGEAGTLVVPAPTGVGAAAVAAGFPRTPEGALSQLAWINQAALSSGSVRVAQEVIAEWAAPGGPTPQNWSAIEGLAMLLGTAGSSSDGSGIAVGLEPKMGFIKGTVGQDFVIPCIDYVLTVTTAGGQSRQVAVADCQRMVWQPGDLPPSSAGDGASGTAEKGFEDAGRWVIGPGEEPAEPPAVWPGSQESFDAGYEWLEFGS